MKIQGKHCFIVGVAGLVALNIPDLTALETKARANLAGRFASLRVGGHDGCYRLELDDYHEASMALLIDRWRDRLEIAGDPVLAIPSREAVLICGSRDAAAIASLRERAASIIQRATYSLSRKLYVYRDGRFSPYESTQRSSRRSRTARPLLKPARTRLSSLFVRA